MVLFRYGLLHSVARGRLLPRTSALKPNERMSSSSAADNDAVLFAVAESKAGVITLNKPKTLNAINRSMVNSIYAKLMEWKDQVGYVVIEGAGDKAFCAGGDVVTVTSEKNTRAQKDFFKEEYVMNHLVGELTLLLTGPRLSAV